MMVWPFSIAASRLLDYRFVVCPEFLENAANRTEFRSKLEMDDGDPARVRTATFAETEMGNMSCLYRVSVISRNGVAQKDTMGRPLLWARGIVTQLPIEAMDPKEISLCFQNFEALFQNSLSEFLNSDREWKAKILQARDVVEASQPSPSAVPIMNTDRNPTDTTPRKAGPARNLPIAIALLAALIAAAGYIQNEKIQTRLDALEKKLAAQLQPIQPRSEDLPRASDPVQQPQRPQDDPQNVNPASGRPPARSNSQ